MANVQHKDIKDPNVHEPKGVTLASNGQAYLADGTGSGAWRDVVTPETGTITSAHITCSFNKSQSYSSAQTRTEMIAANFNQQEVRGDIFTPTSNYILVKEKGFYMVSYRLHYSVTSQIHASSGWLYSDLTVGFSESDSNLSLINAAWGKSPKISAGQNRQGSATTEKEIFRSFSNYFPTNGRFSIWLAPLSITKSHESATINYAISGEVQLTKIPEIV